MWSKRRSNLILGALVAGTLLAGCGDDGGSDGPSPTPTPATGPIITFLGLTRADDVLIEPIGTDDTGIPIYERTNGTGSGFSIVVEAKRGSSGEAVGHSAQDTNLGGFPDLQIISSRALGDGSKAVCDDPQTNPGGVPAAKSFADNDTTIATVNDFACRFIDGSGAPVGRTNTNDSCVTRDTGDFVFVDPTTEIQFCGPINVPLAFQKGDTTVTVRVRDVGGHVGPEQKLIVRVDG